MTQDCLWEDPTARLGFGPHPSGTPVQHCPQGFRRPCFCRRLRAILSQALEARLVFQSLEPQSWESGRLQNPGGDHTVSAGPCAQQTSAGRPSLQPRGPQKSQGSTDMCCEDDGRLFPPPRVFGARGPPPLFVHSPDSEPAPTSAPSVDRVSASLRLLQVSYPGQAQCPPPASGKWGHSSAQVLSW